MQNLVKPKVMVRHRHGPIWKHIHLEHGERSVRCRSINKHSKDDAGQPNLFNSGSYTYHRFGHPVWVCGLFRFYSVFLQPGRFRRIDSELTECAFMRIDLERECARACRPSTSQQTTQEERAEWRS